MSVLKKALVLILCFLPAACHQNQGVFTDITEQSKLNFVHDAAVEGNYFYPEVMGGGAAFLDFDNDGRLDILFVNGAFRTRPSTTTSHLYHQNSDGTFEDVTSASGLASKEYGMGIAVGDIDNDGDMDVYLANYGLDQLYRNNGNGTFSDISKTAGIHSPGWETSAVFLDYDRDGFLDLYVTNYVIYDPLPVCADRAGRRDYCGPQAYRAEPDFLYHNNGNGTFSDVSMESGIANFSGRGLGVVAEDLNGDSYPDIYVANDQESNFLFINQQNGTFREMATALGTAVNVLGQPEASMGVTAGDADGDGDMDLYMTHLRDETNTFYRNQGSTGFQDDTATSGLGAPNPAFTGFGVGLLDFDNDGDLDAAVANGRVIRGPLLTKRTPAQYWDYYAETGQLFENQGPAQFRDITAQAGAFGSDIQNGRALCIGDVDNDGDPDLLVAVDGGPAKLYRNDSKNKGHWLLIRAVNSKQKRDAVGARITVVAGSRKITRSVNPGYSYLSSNDFRVHFGLGAATQIDRIEVTWPDGKQQTFPGSKADQILVIHES